MKKLVKNEKTTLIRKDTVEKACHLINCVMNENPLTTEELHAFDHVREILNDDLWKRSNVEFSNDDVESSLI
jgi:hypothetical protein